MQKKSYFVDDVDADYIMKQCFSAIDNGLHRWYNKGGGEMKCQVKFDDKVGLAYGYGNEPYATNFVTVTYSKSKGFHCYPDVAMPERWL